MTFLNPTSSLCSILCLSCHSVILVFLFFSRIFQAVFHLRVFALVAFLLRFLHGLLFCKSKTQVSGQISLFCIYASLPCPPNLKSLPILSLSSHLTLLSLQHLLLFLLITCILSLLLTIVFLLPITRISHIQNMRCMENMDLVCHIE